MTDELEPPDEFVIDAEAKRMHAVRQPLSAILAAASALRIRTDLPEADRQALLDVIVRGAERLAEMAGDRGEPEAP